MKHSIFSFFFLVLTSISFAQDSTAIYLSLGKKSYENESFKQAIKYYERAASLSPNNFNALIGLGDSKHKLQMFHEAIEQYNLAEGQNAQNAELFLNRGAAYIFIEEYKKALKRSDSRSTLLIENGDFYNIK